MLTEKIKRLIYVLLLIVTIYVFFLVSPFITSIFSFLTSIILPLLISFSLAFVLHPLVTKVQKLVKKRIIAIIIVLLLLIAIFILLLNYTIPKLSKEIDLLIQNLPSIRMKIEIILYDLSSKLSFLPDNLIPNMENITNMINEYINKLGNVPSKLLEVISKYLSIVALIPVCLLYFLLDYEKIIDGLRQYLIKKNYLRLKNCLGEINITMMNFFKGYFFVMLILSFSSTIALVFLNIEFALIFGIIIGITDIIPFIGPYIGGALPVIYTFLESPTKALYVLITIVSLQLIETNLVTPYVQSKQIKTHPLLVVISLIFFGRIFGIIGMIIAVPLLSIIKITFKYYKFPFYKTKPQEI